MTLSPPALFPIVVVAAGVVLVVALAWLRLSSRLATLEWEAEYRAREIADALKLASDAYKLAREAGEAAEDAARACRNLIEREGCRCSR